MTFQFETDYDRKAFTATAKCLRKTVRKKRSRRVHIFAGLVLVCGLYLGISRILSDGALHWRSFATLLSSLLLILISLFEDRLNGWVGRRSLLPGMEHADTTFMEDSYVLKTSVTESKFSFSQILAVAETKRYFVFALSKNQAQTFDKERMSGGSLDDFRAFLTEKTGKSISFVK